jgi:hypothetical protein
MEDGGVDSRPVRPSARRRSGPWCLLLALAAGFPATGDAQSAGPPAAGDSTIRLVVFQFSSVPDDSVHQAAATSLAESVARALAGQPGIVVMPHPRAPRGGGPNARYGIVGAVAANGSSARVDIRVVDIAAMTLLGSETADVSGALTGEVLARMGADLADRVGRHLVSRP